MVREQVLQCSQNGDIGFVTCLISHSLLFVLPIQSGAVGPRSREGAQQNHPPFLPLARNGGMLTLKTSRDPSSLRESASRGL